MKKFLMTIAVFVLISLSAFCAIGSNFKNSLLSVDVKKTGESSYNIILNTQSPYAEPVKVIKKSDYDYYILLPETYSLIPESSSNSDIKNFSVQLFPYAGQSNENGYTKITILTVRPIDFTTSIKSLDNRAPTKTDLDKIAKLNALENSANQTKPVQQKQTTQVQTQKHAPQTQTTQKVQQQSKPQQTVAQKTQTTQKAQQTKPQQTVAQKTQQQTKPQTQSVAQNTQTTTKATNPISVSMARRENITTYNTEPKEVKPQVKEEVKVAQAKPQVKSQIKPQAQKTSQASATKQAKSKAVQTPKKEEPTKSKETPQVKPQQTTEAKPQQTPEVQAPAVQKQEVQKPVTETPEAQAPSQEVVKEEMAQTPESQGGEDVLTFPDDELTNLEDETEPASDGIKGKILSKINSLLNRIPISRSNLIIAVLVFIIFVMAIGRRKKQPEVRVVYQNMPPQNVAQEKSVSQEEYAQNEHLAPNTYIEEPDYNEPIIEERPIIEPNIPKQSISEPVVIQPNVSQQEDVQPNVVEDMQLEPEMMDNEVVRESSGTVSPDELDEVYLDEVDDMEAIEERLDQEEFEADNEIEIEEDEPIIQEEVHMVEETPEVSYQIEEPEVSNVPQIQNEAQYEKQHDIAVQNPIKEQPKVEEERGADVLSSVQIDANKGFCVTYYNNQLILIGYVGENIFLIHKFRRGEITNAQIKFRLSDSNLNEDFYMVKVDNSKFFVKVTPNSMALELLV